MIDKRELLDAASRYSLGPHVVEKDYALGWALAGISAHPELSKNWVFKGGTCLKKCYFETYRFSEDLDFTLKDEAHINAEFLADAFANIADWIYEQSGLEFPADLQDFDIYTNPRGTVSCQGKLSYRGPLASRSGGLPRIKLDLTADEALVLPPVEMQIYHPYSDEPDGGITVLSYAYEETFAEKVRALAERTRPRDLYDVINLFWNENARPAAAVLLDVLKQKCAFKKIDLPKLDALQPHRPTLEGAWEGMLKHQLPSLPAVDVFWNSLADFFAWLESGLAPATAPAFAMGQGEIVLRDRSLPGSIGAAALSALEVIRFAAANRLCVDLDYTDERGNRGQRRIEPYSLRRTQNGDVILHAHNVDKNAHRSYRTDRMNAAFATNQTFVPRHAIELTPHGPIPVSDNPSRATTPAPLTRSSRPRRSAGSSFGRSSSGPTYIYECTVCGKHFRRKNQSSSLNAHKDKSGYPCMGRTGFFVDVKY